MGMAESAVINLDLNQESGLVVDTGSGTETRRIS